MFGRRKVLFLKKLQKSFVFLQKNAKHAGGKGKIPLQFACVWRDSMGFQAWISPVGPLFQDIASHDPGSVD
jgi:hypothetical protein